MINQEGLSDYLKSGLLNEWDLLLAFVGGCWFLMSWMVNAWSTGVWGFITGGVTSLYLIVGLGLICLGLYVFTVDPADDLLRVFFSLVGISFLFLSPVAYGIFEFDPGDVLHLFVFALKDAVAFSIVVLGFAYLKKGVLKISIVTVLTAVGLVGVIPYTDPPYADLSQFGEWVMLGSVWFGPPVLGNFLSGNRYEGMRNAAFIAVLVQIHFSFSILWRGTGGYKPWWWFIEVALGTAVVFMVVATVLASIATAYHGWTHRSE